MLDTKKLLYILPDVAYVAELLPTKKEHTFSIHSFRQINGEFLDEDNLLPDNIEKLFSKIEAEKYHLVLPDFLFTNTIVEVKETAETKVKTYIKDELLPSLELSKDTHEIETFILTQHNNASKVQLTAVERSALDPIVASAKNHDVEIVGISPLSWTIKSIVSLEPSITLVQIGSMLYLAEHYIGVDQCTTFKVDEIENVGESIKTLKGSQPSIQTIYLLTNGLVEDKLKELVSSTLPIQQLASFKEEESQMPSYVKHIIESGLKTLDIKDYPVPTFALPKTTSGLPPAVSAKDEAEEEDEVVATKPKAEDKAEAPLVAPRPPEEEKETKPNATDEEETAQGQDDTGAIEPEVVSEPIPLPPVTPAASLPAPSTIELAATAESATSEETPPAPAVVQSEDLDVDTETTDLKKETIDTTDDTDQSNTEESTKPESSSIDEPSLDKFAPATAVPAGTTAPSKTLPLEKDTTVQTSSPPVIIKNKSGTGSMVRMIFITLAVFCATVAIGVGIGLGVLSLTGNGGNQVSPAVTPSPVAQVSPSPLPSLSPSPSASAAATVNKAQTPILVVNATTTPGYAGTTKTKLERAGYKPVTAANAKGEYEPGFYVLMETEDPALIAQLETDSGLDLEYATGYATEDPTGTNQAVIVLAR